MKLTKVAQVCQHSQMLALILHQDTPLETAIRHFADNPHIRSIFVVDNADKLVGIINNHDLLPWVRMQLDMLPFGSAVSVGKLRWLLMAEKISDLIPVSSDIVTVTVNDSLADVLDIMFQHNLVDIPVVDGDGRIINDIRLNELLAYTLNQSGVTTNAS